MKFVNIIKLPKVNRNQNRVIMIANYQSLLINK